MALSFLKRASTRKPASKDPEQTADETSQTAQPQSQAATAESPVSPLTPTQDADIDADDYPSPILDASDELFLRRIASEGTPPPLPARRTVITDDGHEVDLSRAPSPMPSDATPVPDPAAAVMDRRADDDGKSDKEKEKERRKEAQRQMWNEWLFVPAAQGKEMVLNRMSSLRKGKESSKDTDTEEKSDDKSKEKKKDKGKGKEKEKAKDKNQDSDAVIDDNTTTDSDVDTQEAKKEKRDLNSLLSSLNLNNRMMSLSEDSRKLLDDFVLILKDIVNGVPTAYDDMEKLLTQREKQLAQLYGSLPPFLQTLVKSLPMKMWAALAPEVAAAARADKEKDERDRKRRGSNVSSGGEGSSKDKSSTKKKATKYVIPTLRTLVSEKGAVVAMLRSIMGFLQMRFPMVLTGTNVVLGLAVFVLLFVFWYCWKRGRDTRLERDSKERGSDDEGADEGVEKREVDLDRDERSANRGDGRKEREDDHEDRDDKGIGNRG